MAPIVGWNLWRITMVKIISVLNWITKTQEIDYAEGKALEAKVSENAPYRQETEMVR